MLNSPHATRRILLAYYAATALFLILDYALNVNLRLSFLEGRPDLRAAYYGVCFVCLALMMWRPAWTVLIGAFESLITIVLLIVGMWVKFVLISEDPLEYETSPLRAQAIFNYLISGAIAYVAWFRGIKQLKDANFVK